MPRASEKLIEGLKKTNIVHLAQLVSLSANPLDKSAYLTKAGAGSDKRVNDLVKALQEMPLIDIKFKLGSTLSILYFSYFSPFLSRYFP